MVKTKLLCLFYFLLSLSIQAQDKRLDAQPDLKIDSIEFVDRPGFLPFLNQGKALFPFLPIKERNLYVRYTISNIGNGSAELLGKESKKFDNIAIRAYFSGDKKLNKGDFLADGTYLPNDMPNAGVLQPGESFSGIMRVSLAHKSRFINVLILKIDDLSKLDEFDETNNTFPYVLKGR